MSLTEQINNDIKVAMKAREKEKLAALRDIKAKILLEATSSGGLNEISQSIENKIVLKLHKQRMDSYALFVEQNRQDLADDELFQAKVIEKYLPKMMNEEEIKIAVLNQIKKIGATGPKDMGKVMGPLSKELAGKADGKLISTIVKNELNK